MAAKYEVRAKLMDIMKKANPNTLTFPCVSGEKIGDGSFVNQNHKNH